jgi:hypothetical protein
VKARPKRVPTTADVDTLFPAIRLNQIPVDLLLAYWHHYVFMQKYDPKKELLCRAVSGCRVATAAAPQLPLSPFPC